MPRGNDLAARKGTFSGKESCKTFARKLQVTLVLLARILKENDSMQEYCLQVLDIHHFSLGGVIPCGLIIKLINGDLNFHLGITHNFCNNLSTNSKLLI